jgi:uridine kinase
MRLAAVIESLTRLGTAAHTDDRSMVLAVDGRSSSGKTTLAAQVQTAVAGSAVIHTDDLAWWHSRFGWADLLIEGILMPAHQGQPVSFRPPSWAEHGRAGSIDVPADCPLLIIEGVGAGRREATRLVDALIWVQSDQAEAERRSLARVGQTGGPRTVQNLREWMAEEEPFLAEQRPWERADLVVAGTPQIPFDPLTELVVAQRQPGTTKT